MIGGALPVALVAVAIFIGVSGGLYWLGGRWAPRGKDSPGKYLPYACGEDLGVGDTRLSYQAFFHLALMFVVVHMAALVVATLPSEGEARVLATCYLLGVAVCVEVLTRG